MSHMNLFFPQWQGSGKDRDLLEGALEIKEKYVDISTFIEIPVYTGKNELIENNILGYKRIMQQTEAAMSMISEKNPSTIFSIGGGCDIEIAPISYLNDQMDGNLTVLWFDAHGDLNTPDSSPSKLFHGMPLRTLLGDGDKNFTDKLFSKLLPNQLILIGTRDLDGPEAMCIKNNAINVLTIGDVEADLYKVVDTVIEKGSKKVYIHIDLDVLDPQLFPYVMCPAEKGLKPELLLKLLKLLNDNFHVIGLSLLEYTASGQQDLKLLSDIIEMGINL